MNLSFHPTAPADSPRVRAFLREIFQADDHAPFLDEAQIDWKYYRPHPLWEGSRSFVYEADTGIAAHACAWPVQLLTTDGLLTVVHPVDWAASTRIPGVGALLLRQMRSLRDVSCCVGGTDIARKVIAQSDYRVVADLEFYARPLRPLRQALMHQRRDWKLPARLAKNLAWTVRSIPSIPARWTAEPIEPRHLPDAVLPEPRPGTAVARRTRELFEYLRLCPVARYQLFLIENAGEPIGYFLLSFTPGQARICDASVREPTTTGWRGLYASAVRAALDEGSAAEITAASSNEACRDALGTSGFRLYRAQPIMLFDERNRLAAHRRIHLQMIDGDFSFLHQNRPEYHT